MPPPETPPERRPEPQEGAEEATQPEPSEDAPRPPEGAAPTAEEGGSEVARLRREAARYRTERNRLAERVAAFQRTEVERVAAERLEDGSDVWRHDGTELDSLLTDQGEVDPERVAEAVENVLEAHPGWAKGRAVDFGAGVRQPLPQAPSFGAAFKQSIGRTE
jgi:hypothetical protein